MRFEDACLVLASCQGNLAALLLDRLPDGIDRLLQPVKLQVRVVCRVCRHGRWRGAKLVKRSKGDALGDRYPGQCAGLCGRSFDIVRSFDCSGYLLLAKIIFNQSAERIQGGTRLRAAGNNFNLVIFDCPQGCQGIEALG